MNELQKLRRKLLREIKAIIAPHLWESGYRTPIDRSKGIFGGTRAVKLWVHKDEQGNMTEKVFKIRGMLIDEIDGFTEDGVITDSSYMLTTTYWRGVPLEDLFKIKALAQKLFPPKH